MLPVVGWPGGCCAARCSAETGADSPGSTVIDLTEGVGCLSIGYPAGGDLDLRERAVAPAQRLASKQRHREKREHEQRERSRKSSLVGENTDNRRADDETGVAERERCCERRSGRIDSSCGAEEQRYRVCDPEAAEYKAEDGGNGVADQEHAAERDRDHCRTDAKQHAGADPLVDEVTAKSRDGHPQREPRERKCSRRGLAPVLCLR